MIQKYTIFDCFCKTRNIDYSLHIGHEGTMRSMGTQPCSIGSTSSLGHQICLVLPSLRLYRCMNIYGIPFFASISDEKMDL